MSGEVKKESKQVVIRCGRGYLSRIDEDHDTWWTDNRDQALRMKFADAQEHLRRICKTNPEAMIIAVRS